jgi:hypothetical protein
MVVGAAAASERQYVIPQQAMMSPEATAFHRRTSDHREAVLASRICGCGYCCKTFAPTEIVDWVGPYDADDVGQTADCPKCGVDAVLPDVPPGVLTEAFLKRMHDEWFRAV